MNQKIWLACPRSGSFSAALPADLMNLILSALLAAWAVVAVGAQPASDPVPAAVDIAAGTFVRGSDRAERELAYRLDEQAYGHGVTREQKWYEGEPSRGESTTGHYAITLTPITNRQYAAFVAATGHRVPGVSRSVRKSYGLIHAFERTRPFAWSKGRPPRGREDHPVVLVSQEDARAYAAWLSRKTGMRWRLPTEAEWEKAARGTDGRYFPWGNKFDAAHLNSADSGPFGTVPVGRFLSGASPFGMLDAAGQVYEWTSHASGPNSVIVKGGSWDDRGCGVCRPAARHSRPAALKHILIGFRLVREPLQPVARVGPWSAVSSLIGFRGRLWFANSVKFADHNSADLYSYDLHSGAVRYERHLFSQDAGQPAVAGGLLYWPFEDARFSAGRGEFMVTNGRDWQWRELPYRPVLHLHAMLAHGGFLYAATGGFSAALYRSADLGKSWTPVYQHRNAAGSFSRLLSLRVFSGRVYVGLYASDEPGVKLGQVSAGRFVAVPGWPRGESAEVLTVFRGHLYAIHHGGDGAALWRTDGRSSEPVRALAGRAVRATAASKDSLWVVTGGEGRGDLWQSADGEAWQVVQRFDRDEPVDVAVYGGPPYVGAIGSDGRGVLYGSTAHAPVRSAIGLTALPAFEPPRPGSALAPQLAALDRALADLASFEQAGGALIDLLDPIVRSRSRRAAQALANRIGAAGHVEASVRFAGNRVAAKAKADWQLLRAIGQIGQGRVPAELLAKRWSASANRGEKYVESVAGAAWAISESRQSDAPTTSALIERLNSAGHPTWLAGDLIGALTALSGCRFGYDAAAWRAWWENRGPTGDHPGAPAESCGTLGPGLLAVPGGTFTMGDPDGEPDEAPRSATVKSFRIMRFEVTNAEFRQFVRATKHMTDAERRRSGYVWTDRWRAVRGASWTRPQGGKSGPQRLERHPVVQVSARDAAAYCAWRGLRLPTEEEWEFAARGTDGRRFPWGNERPEGARRANYGTDKCCAADASDGFLRTAPVGSFPRGASPFGIHDMAGNVWEWTASHYRRAGADVAIRGGGWGNDPYCLRASYRHGNPPDIGLDMVGFRCASDQ